jgi:hypothetical protein
MGKGKEAMTVRHAILVIALVAASFLGGAFVNGPGWQWTQARLLRSLGLANGGEIASIDLKATPTSDPAADRSGPAKREAEMMPGPVAPAPSLIAENESSEHDASLRHSALQPKSPSGDTASPRSKPVSPSSTTPAGTASPSSRTASRLDRNVTPASVASPAASSRAATPSDSNVAPAILDSLTALLPSTPSAPSGASAPAQNPSPSRELAADGGDEWAVLERKMQTLGVSRYALDGQPGGHVVFWCLIPLAGRQAVAQRFEAEGDDALHAAQAALRRIALWRATQPPSP